MYSTALQTGSIFCTCLNFCYTKVHAIFWALLIIEMCKPNYKGKATFFSCRCSRVLQTYHQPAGVQAGRL